MSTNENGVPVRNTYDKYGTTNPIERRLMAGFMESLSVAIGGLKPREVLEVGAGEGEITAVVARMFPDTPVHGMDLPDEGTADSWREHSVNGFFGDMRQLPIRDKTIDLVLGIEVLEHVPEPDRALVEIARICRGAVVLSVPREPIWRGANMARGKYLGDMGNTPGHINHWSKRGFKQFVSTQFDVDWDASPFPWTMVRGVPRG